MKITDILGWIANFLFIIGAYGLAKRKVYGFYAQFLANCLYVSQSFILINYPLFWLSIGLGLFNLYGIYEWRKNA